VETKRAIGAPRFARRTAAMPFANVRLPHSARSTRNIEQTARHSHGTQRQPARRPNGTLSPFKKSVSIVFGNTPSASGRVVTHRRQRPSPADHTRASSMARTAASKIARFQCAKRRLRAARAEVCAAPIRLAMWRTKALESMATHGDQRRQARAPWSEKCSRYEHQVNVG
jgi:hypothetical protein